MNTKAYAAFNAVDPLGPYTIERRDLSPKDILIKIEYCGVCHSDLHTAKSDWGSTNYPAVPGHEIVGRVEAVGKEVTRFKAGDVVGVGCMVESCKHCHSCDEGLEQYCENGLREPIIPINRNMEALLMVDILKISWWKKILC